MNWNDEPTGERKDPWTQELPRWLEPALIVLAAFIIIAMVAIWNWYAVAP